jgi:hypothetical protein
VTHILLRFTLVRSILAVSDCIYDFFCWARHAGSLYRMPRNGEDTFRTRYNRHKVEKLALFNNGVGPALPDTLVTAIAPGQELRAFEQLVCERRSVRTYSGSIIPNDVITQCVALAKRSPSACNRQAVRVHVYSDKKQVALILERQNGNRGFGRSADKLLLITYDLRALVSSAERNLPFLDGGLFAMTLIYALQDSAVATCCLNVNSHWFRDIALRCALGILPQETPVLLIAIGGYPATCRVPASTRVATEALLRFH